MDPTSPPPPSTSPDALPGAPRDAHDTFTDGLVGARIGGRYVVERILGRGGMGVVAHARYPELEQSVAIKLMWPEHAANTTLNARFLREARLAAEVHSGHLVRVFDVGRLDSGVPYMVMEMLSGRDLGAELRDRKTLSVEDAVDWILQAATGIAEFHARGVVHRDLKPSNLFLADGAGSQTVKVLDFGVSKESILKKAGDLTASEHLIGTPHYMSPEQIKTPNGVDTRSDIWSVGIILYELLTGELPFETEAEGIGELFGLILFTEPRRARALRPELPEGLDGVIAKCLRRARDERFASVGELALALRPYAPARALHRIDAIARTMQTAPLPVAAAASEPSLAGASAMEDAPKSTLVLGRRNATPSGSDAPVKVSSVEPGTVAGALWSSDSLSASPKKPSPRRTGTLVVVATTLLCAVAILVTFALRSRPVAPSAVASEPGASATPSVAGAAVTVSPASPADPALTAPVASAPLAAETAAPAAVASVAASKPTTSPHPHGPRPSRPAASAQAPATGAPTRPDPNPDLLILDRK